MTTNNPTMGDKEFMGDMLSSQKDITGLYNTFANECACPELQNEFLSILREEHQIQHEVFAEMQKRGWYQTENAQQQKIDQAKQKYGQGV